MGVQFKLSNTLKELSLASLYRLSLTLRLSLNFKQGELNYQCQNLGVLFDGWSMTKQIIIILDQNLSLISLIMFFVYFLFIII